MIIVHHLNESRSHRILWLLEELGLSYEIQQYWRDARTKLTPPELKEVHPLGKSPVITDGDRVVAESGAIIDYIIRRHGGGRLQPDPATAAFDEYVQWLHYSEGSASLPLVVKSIAAAFGKAAAPLNRMVVTELDNHLSFINGALSQNDYLLGDAISGADIQLSFVAELAEARADLSGYPNVGAWMRRFRARPAYRAAIQRGGGEAPS